MISKPQRRILLVAPLSLTLAGTVFIWRSQSPAGSTIRPTEAPKAVEALKPSAPSIQTTPQALDPKRPYFAFAVAEGRKVLLSGPRVSNPESLAYLLLPGGMSRRINLDGFQEGDNEGNGRDAAYNLQHLQGTQYEVQGEPLEEDRSYLLASNAFLTNRTPLKITPIKGTLPPKVIPPLEQLKKRKVKRSWALADIGGKAQLYWVIFEPMKGQQALASMLLLAGQNIASQDVLGASDNSQTWRVGDDEESAGDGFKILYACETPTGFEWAYSWAAEEGEDLGYAIQKGDQLEEMQGTDVYRYLAPM